jgi:hypothetical protein
MTWHRRRIQRHSKPEARLAFSPLRPRSETTARRIGWGVEGLIIEQGAAEAVGLLPMLGQGRCDDLVRLVDQLSPIVW